MGRRRSPRCIPRSRIEPKVGRISCRSRSSPVILVAAAAVAATKLSKKSESATPGGQEGEAAGVGPRFELALRSFAIVSSNSSRPAKGVGCSDPRSVRDGHHERVPAHGIRASASGVDPHGQAGTAANLRRADGWQPAHAAVQIRPTTTRRSLSVSARTGRPRRHDPEGKRRRDPDAHDDDACAVRVDDAEPGHDRGPLLDCGCRRQGRLAARSTDASKQGRLAEEERGRGLRRRPARRPARPPPHRARLRPPPQPTQPRERTGSIRSFIRK